MITPDGFVAILEKWFLETNPNEKYTYDLWAWGNFERYLDKPTQIGDLRFEIVEIKDTGDREDFTDGEPVYYVVKVVYIDIEPEYAMYFRRDGVVQSWDGDEMGDWYRVRPREKTITVYE